MTEASFAKTFLATLDTRPVKLSADHVEDPRKYSGHPPYILPRMSKPMSKPLNLAPGQERSITVTLKSLRNPPLEVKLTSQPLDTSILDIKNGVTSQTRIPVDKMKILHNKRPLQDSKILKEIIGDTETAVEFSVMVMGGAAAIPPEQADTVMADATTADALESNEFWNDLGAFLMQRLKDKSKADELSSLFKSSWEANRTK